MMLPRHSALVLYLTDHSKKEVHADKLCVIVMLDLQKPFDSLGYGNLLYNLRAIQAINWVHYYLTGRNPKGDVDGTVFGPKAISYGVP